MAPTPALWALFLCTCSPVASKIPSFTEMERWEKEAIRSSFQPVGQSHRVSEPITVIESVRESVTRASESVSERVSKSATEAATGVSELVCADGIDHVDKVLPSPARRRMTWSSSGSSEK